MIHFFENQVIIILGLYLVWETAVFTPSRICRIAEPLSKEREPL